MQRADEREARGWERDRGLKVEAIAPPEVTLADQQWAFDRFRHEYNDERPHEALGLRRGVARAGQPQNKALELEKLR